MKVITDRLSCSKYSKDENLFCVGDGHVGHLFSFMCSVFFFVFVMFPVPNVACVSVLSILDYPFCFL